MSEGQRRNDQTRNKAEGSEENEEEEVGDNLLNW